MDSFPVTTGATGGTTLGSLAPDAWKTTVLCEGVSIWILSDINTPVISLLYCGRLNLKYVSGALKLQVLRYWTVVQIK
jgi:hypothetical protein